MVKVLSERWAALYYRYKAVGKKERKKLHNPLADSAPRLQSVFVLQINEVQAHCSLDLHMWEFIERHGS